MAAVCNICARYLTQPIYISPSSVSVTSLYDIRPEKTEVFFCDGCGHLQTPALSNVEDYYDRNYRIQLDSEDQDEIYEVTPSRTVYRAEHQANVLLEKAPIPAGGRVLDYGSAKAATLRRVTASRRDIEPHVFDVSDAYRLFWEQFVPTPNQATYVLPAEWVSRFDLVTSFYAFEHIPDPSAAMKAVFEVLAEGGTFYGVVPYWRTNVADAVVIDHINHFSPGVLRNLLRRAGFTAIEVDAEAHKGALVWLARKSGPTDDLLELDLAELEQSARSVCDYWSTFASRLQDFEANVAKDRPSAIYGSGFYGTYLMTCLRTPSRVSCFIDKNPHRQGVTHVKLPIVSPDELPEAVEVIYVGLNPKVGRDEIAKVGCWQARSLEVFFP